jgi:hypothetical protein
LAGASSYLPPLDFSDLFSPTLLLGSEKDKMSPASARSQAQTGIATGTVPATGSGSSHPSHSFPSHGTLGSEYQSASQAQGQVSQEYVEPAVVSSKQWLIRCVVADEARRLRAVCNRKTEAETQPQTQLRHPCPPLNGVRNRPKQPTCKSKFICNSPLNSPVCYPSSQSQSCSLLDPFKRLQNRKPPSALKYFNPNPHTRPNCPISHQLSNHTPSPVFPCRALASVSTLP